MTPLLFPILACSEQELINQKDWNSEFIPVISVQPNRIDFISNDNQTQSSSFSITNIGDGLLEIENIELDNNLDFSIWHDTKDLQTNDSMDVVVDYRPQSNQNIANGNISIYSNDPEHNLSLVEVTGQGRAPDFTVFPNPVDFGEVLCDGEQSVVLSNSGDASLDVLALVYDIHENFSIVNEDILPITLEPNQSEILQIEFIPEQSELVEWSFDILTSNQEEITTVQTLGSQFSIWKEEFFEIEGSINSDILFSVDLSSSMSDEAELLGQQFETFITELSNYTTDWQVMVVNADHGCNHSGILTAQTPNYTDTFLTAVQTGAYDISFTEALLTNVTNAVEKTDVGECNEGFLRSGAMLHIIMLSDECEQSPNPGICGTQWQDYIDRIVQQKGDASLVRMSAIAGDYPSGCGNPTSAQFGSGYWESTQLTNGLFISICSNWTDPYYLQQLALTSTQIAEFELQSQPIETSIIVLLNGIQSNNYTYNSTTNSVQITESITSSTSVSIQYQEKIECSEL